MKNNDDDLAKNVAKNIEEMFGESVNLESQDPNTGEIILTNTSEIEVKRYAPTINPLNGKPFIMLYTYAAKCIKERDDDVDYPKIGEPIQVDFTGTQFYMHNREGLVCNSRAKLNIDFELLNIPGNDVGFPPNNNWFVKSSEFKRLCKEFYDGDE